MIFKDSILRSSLFWRFFFIIVIPIVILLSVTVFIFYHRHWKNVTNTLLSNVIRELDMSIEEVIDLDSSATSRYIYSSKYLNDIKKIGERHNFQILSISSCLKRCESMNDCCKSIKDISTVDYSNTFNVNNHHILFDRGLQELYYLLLSKEKLFAKKGISMKYLNYIDNEREILIIFQLPKSKIAIIFHNNRIESSTTYIFVLWVLIIALILFIISILFVKNQLRSILDLTTAAEKVSRGEDISNFTPRGAREIRCAGKASLAMKNRLERNVRDRTELLSHIAHDMRTPITRLKLQLALAEINEDMRLKMQKNIQEMENLLNSYLQFAKSEGNESMEHFDFISMLNDVIASQNEINNEKKIIIYNSICDNSSNHKNNSDNFLFSGRKMALKRCITNILQNATYYAKTCVEIKTSLHDNVLQILIEDDGLGIKILDDQNEMFKAFQVSGSGGYGLGLAISRSIVSAHGGNIFLYRSKLGGLGIKITLPM